MPELRPREPSGRQRPSSSGTAGEPPRPKLLVIDDDALLRECFRELLGDAYELIEAPDGQSGLRLARSTRPDLVLLDLRLPDISGLDVLSELRTLAPLLPIVVVTAVTGAQSAVEAMKRGATDYVTKPFQHDELPTVLERARNHPATSEESREERPARPFRMLLIAPHQGRRVVLSVLLRRYGPVVSAATIDAARAAMPEPHIGLVVVDDHGAPAAPPASAAILSALGIEAPVVRLAGAPGSLSRTSATRSSLGVLIDAARRRLGGVAAELPPVGAGLSRALEFVAAHYATRLTVSSLAREAGLSESYFAHVFRMDTGLSVRRILRRIRVEIAKEMLAEGDTSLREVAQAVGFVDGSHLARAFRAETGLSVKIFRLALERTSRYHSAAG